MALSHGPFNLKLLQRAVVLYKTKSYCSAQLRVTLLQYFYYIALQYLDPLPKPQHWIQERKNLEHVLLSIRPFTWAGRDVMMTLTVLGYRSVAGTRVRQWLARENDAQTHRLGMNAFMQNSLWFIAGKPIQQHH